MSDQIFKAVITHFESGQKVFRFGTKLYEIFEINEKHVMLSIYQLGKNGMEFYLLEPEIDFDKACALISKDVESQIIFHWAKESA